LPELAIQRQIQAPPEVVWEVLNDFGEIQRWSPGVKYSVLTSEGPVGLGSTRHCDFTPMGRAEERIETYEPLQRMTVRLYDMAWMPLVDATADFRLAASDGGTDLTFHYSFTPNLLGRLMGRVFGSQMHKGLEGIVDGLRRESEHLAQR
jgi:uncharacterized protein YndB with AHSA1/START domain